MASDGQSPRRDVIAVLDSDDDAADMAPLDAKATPAQAPVQPSHSAVPAAADQAAASTAVSIRRANDAAIRSLSSGCSNDSPAGTGSDGHRQPLTEAEQKEAQRLRRIISNRESARKTSLRRKALIAELEKKVAELATEKENLKKEKDEWMEKYLALLEKQQQEAKMTQKSRPLPSLNCAMPPVPFTWAPLQVVAAAEEEGHHRLLPLFSTSQETTMQAAPLRTQEPPTSSGLEDDDPCSLSLAINAPSDY